MFIFLHSNLWKPYKMTAIRVSSFLPPQMTYIKLSKESLNSKIFDSNFRILLFYSNRTNCPINLRIKHFRNPSPFSHTFHTKIGQTRESDSPISLDLNVASQKFSIRPFDQPSLQRILINWKKNDQFSMPNHHLSPTFLSTGPIPVWLAI